MVSNLHTDVRSQAPNTGDSESDLIAIGLIKLQQRLDALDRLYNEEVSNLGQELTKLKADYVRLHQARSALRRKGKSQRGRASREPPGS